MSTTIAAKYTVQTQSSDRNAVSDELEETPTTRFATPPGEEVAADQTLYEEAPSTVTKRCHHSTTSTPSSTKDVEARGVAQEEENSPSKLVDHQTTNKGGVRLSSLITKESDPKLNDVLGTPEGSAEGTDTPKSSLLASRTRGSGLLIGGPLTTDTSPHSSSKPELPPPRSASTELFPTPSKILGASASPQLEPEDRSIYLKLCKQTWVSVCSDLSNLPGQSMNNQDETILLNDRNGSQRSSVSSLDATPTKLNIATVSMDGGDSRPANALPFWHDLEVEGYPSNYFAHVLPSLNSLHLGDVDLEDEVKIMGEDLVLAAKMMQDLGAVQPARSVEVNDSVQMYLHQCVRLLAKPDFWYSLKATRDRFVKDGAVLIYELVRFIKGDEREESPTDHRSSMNFSKPHTGAAAVTPKNAEGSDSNDRKSVSATRPPRYDFQDDQVIEEISSPGAASASSASFETPNEQDNPHASVMLSRSLTQSEMSPTSSPNHRSPSRGRVSATMHSERWKAMDKFLAIGPTYAAGDIPASWLCPRQGVVIHLWSSEKAARLFIKSWSFVWDTLMEHRLESIRAPLSVFYLMEGFCFTVSALPPIVDQSEPVISVALDRSKKDLDLEDPTRDESRNHSGEEEGTSRRQAIGSILDLQINQLVVLTQAPYSSGNTDKENAAQLHLHPGADGSFYLLQLDWIYEQPETLLLPEKTSCPRELFVRKVWDSSNSGLRFVDYIRTVVVPEVAQALVTYLSCCKDAARNPAKQVQTHVKEKTLLKLSRQRGLPSSSIPLLLSSLEDIRRRKKESSVLCAIASKLVKIELLKVCTADMLLLELSRGSGAMPEEEGKESETTTSGSDLEEKDFRMESMKATKIAAGGHSRRLHIVNRFMQELTRSDRFWKEQICPFVKQAFATHCASAIPFLHFSLGETEVSPLLVHLAETVGLEYDSKTSRFIRFSSIGACEAALFDLQEAAVTARNSLGTSDILASEWGMVLNSPGKNSALATAVDHATLAAEPVTYCMIPPSKQDPSTTLEGFSVLRATLSGGGIPFTCVSLRQAFILRAAWRTILTKRCYPALTQAWYEACDGPAIAATGAGEGRLSPFALQLSGLVLEQKFAFGSCERFALNSVMPSLTLLSTEHDAAFVGNRMLHCSALMTDEFSNQFYNESVKRQLEAWGVGTAVNLGGDLELEYHQRRLSQTEPRFNATPYMLALECIMRVPWIDATFSIAMTQALREIESRQHHLSNHQVEEYLEKIVNPLCLQLKKSGRYNHCANFRYRVARTFRKHPIVLLTGGAAEIHNAKRANPILLLASRAYHEAVAWNEANADQCDLLPLTANPTLLMFLVSSIALRGCLHSSDSDAQENTLNRTAVLCDKVLAQCDPKETNDVGKSVQLVQQLAEDSKAFKLLEQCSQQLSGANDHISASLLRTHLRRRCGKASCLFNASALLQRVGQGYLTRKAEVSEVWKSVGVRKVTQEESHTILPPRHFRETTRLETSEKMDDKNLTFSKSLERTSPNVKDDGDVPPETMKSTGGSMLGSSKILLGGLEDSHASYSPSLPPQSGVEASTTVG